MDKHPHRLSDPATVKPVDAIVDLDTTQTREVLCLNRVECDLELNSGSSKTGPEKLEPQGTRGKGRLSDKYIAGLLDSDGSIQLMWVEPVQRDNQNGTGLLRCSARVQFAQKASGREFMELIANSLTPPSAQDLWGCLAITQDTGTHTWTVAGSRAVSVLMRLRKYLVAKRALADCAIEMYGKFFNQEDGAKKFSDRIGKSPMPKHPTRKWAAGYLDGDGTFNVSLPQGMGGHVTLQACGPDSKRVALDLLMKAYGGSIREYDSPHGTRLAMWTLNMMPSKILSMFESTKGGLAKHFLLKTDQVYFLIGCAKLGHFRDGIRIQQGLHQLRSQPHRLSGPGADVARLLKTVRDVPSFMGPDAQQRKRQWAEANA